MNIGSTQHLLTSVSLKDIYCKAETEYFAAYWFVDVVGN